MARADNLGELELSLTNLLYTLPTAEDVINAVDAYPMEWIDEEVEN